MFLSSFLSIQEKAADNIELQESYRMNTTKKIFWSVFSLLLAVMTIWAGLSQSGKEPLIQIFRLLLGADKKWLMIALICSWLFVIMEAAALHSLLNGIGMRRSFSRCFLYSTSDIYFSAITPSATGGQPASAFFMIKDGIPDGVSTATLVVNLVLYTLSVIVIGLFSLLFYGSIFRNFRLLSRILVIIGFCVLSGLCVLFFLLLRNGRTVFHLMHTLTDFLKRKKIIRNEERLHRRLDVAEKEYGEYVTMMKNRSSILLRAFFCNLLQRASQIAVPMCLYLAFGGSIRLAGKIFASQGLVTIGYNFVPIPGAMGVADFLMVDAFTDIIGAEDAFQLELLSRSLTFYLCVAVSGIITGIGYMMIRRKSKGGNQT